jgi:hypothetical protein
MDENMLRSLYRVHENETYFNRTIRDMANSVRNMTTPFGISIETLEPILGGDMIKYIQEFFKHISERLDFLLNIMPYINATLPQILFILMLYIFRISKGTRIGILAIIMFLLFVSTISTLYSLFPDMRKAGILGSLPSIIVIIIYIIMFFVISKSFLNSVSLQRSLFILFIAWYSLFWAGAFGKLEGSSLSLYPRFSESYFAFMIPLEVSMVSSMILSMSPFVLYLTHDREKNDREKTPTSPIKLKSLFTRSMEYWKAFYGQVIAFGGGLTSDIMLLSFSLGIILTSIYSTIPFFYPFFTPSGTSVYNETLSISDIIQDIEVLAAGMLLWTSPLMALLIFPDRVITTSMGARIRRIIMKNMKETVVVVGGANRMVRPLLDKLVGILEEESDLILRENAELSMISEKICVVDYAGSLPDFSYEDPVLGDVGAIQLEVGRETLLVPCVSIRGGERVDNVRDILSKLSDVTGEEPKAIIVASRDIEIQHAIVEKKYTEQIVKEEGKKRGNNGSPEPCCSIIAVGAETSTDYRIYHKISERLMNSRNERKIILFIEPYTENIAENIFQRIFAFVNDKEVNITLIGYGNALGYLIRLLGLAAYHLQIKVNINALIYPHTEILRKLTPLKIDNYEPIECEISQFLRWNPESLEGLEKGRVKIKMYPLPSAPLHAIFSKKCVTSGGGIDPCEEMKIGEIINILKKADLIVFLEDPKLEGRAIRVADYIVRMLFEDGRVGKPHILIAEGDLLSLGEPLNWIKERIGKEGDPAGIYIYDETTDPFHLIAAHLLQGKSEEDIVNAYFCVESSELPKFLAQFEGTSESWASEGGQVEVDMSKSNNPGGQPKDQVEVILPKVYSCYYNPRRRVGEAIVRDSSSIRYLYVCFDESVQVSKIFSEYSVDTFVRNKEGVIEAKYLRSSEGNVIFNKGILFSCKGESEGKKVNDEICPNDFICPPAFLKAGSLNLEKKEEKREEKKEEKRYKILYMKTRPCIVKNNERRVLVEIYASKEEGGDEKKDSSEKTEDISMYPQLIVKDLCPLSDQCKPNLEKENVYFRLYPDP